MKNEGTSSKIYISSHFWAFSILFLFFALLYFRDFRSNILIHEYDEIWKGFEAITEVFNKISKLDRSLRTLCLSSKIGHMASFSSSSPVEVRKNRYMRIVNTYIAVHFSKGLTTTMYTVLQTALYRPSPVAIAKAVT